MRHAEHGGNQPAGFPPAARRTLARGNGLFQQRIALSPRGDGIGPDRIVGPAVAQHDLEGARCVEHEGEIGLGEHEEPRPGVRALPRLRGRLAGMQFAVAPCGDGGQQRLARGEVAVGRGMSNARFRRQLPQGEVRRTARADPLHGEIHQRIAQVSVVIFGGFPPCFGHAGSPC